MIVLHYVNYIISVWRRYVYPCGQIELKATYVYNYHVKNMICLGLNAMPIIYAKEFIIISFII